MKKKHEKINAKLELEKKRPKIQQKSILGRSWAVFGKGLGPSWAFFGCFWPSLGRFLGVQNRVFFKHWSKIGSKRPSGSIWGRFWTILGGFGEDLGRDLGESKAFWAGCGRILAEFGEIRPCWDRFSNWTPALIREASQCAGVLPPAC